MRLPTRLLRRFKFAHKGDFGHIFMLAGSSRYAGAASLCSLAAMRSGAGLVTIGIPKKLLAGMIRIKPAEVMLLPLPDTLNGSISFSAYQKIKDFLKGISILVVGPGLTQDVSTQRLIRKIIRENELPIIIDADGINALAGYLKILRAGKASAIITPHPAEMARLVGKSVGYVQANRKKIALEFAKKHRIVLVLKGHHTVVADWKNRAYINKTGNPGMATAGSGDVLTGIIAAFLAQGQSAFDSAKLAVYIHGLAGDMAAREKTEIGLIASDIIEKIPQALKRSS